MRSNPSRRNDLRLIAFLALSAHTLRQLRKAAEQHGLKLATQASSTYSLEIQKRLSLPRHPADGHAYTRFISSSHCGQESGPGGFSSGRRPKRHRREAQLVECTGSSRIEVKGQRVAFFERSGFRNQPKAGWRRSKWRIRCTRLLA